MAHDQNIDCRGGAQGQAKVAHNGVGRHRPRWGSLSAVAPPLLVPLLSQPHLSPALSESRRPIRARSAPCRPSSVQVGLYLFI
jgi:hypothetical protein